MEFERVLPEEIGVSSVVLIDFLNDIIADSEQDLHTIMVLKDDKIILEKAIAPYSLSIPSSVFSISKIFVSIAIGLAIDENQLSLDEKIISIFKDYLPQDYDERLNVVTVYDCLTMHSGHGQRNRSVFINSKNEHILEEVLSLHLDYNPREKFVYNSIASFLLACSIKIKIGISITEYLEKRLFKPTQMDVPYWQKTKQGFEYGAYGMKLKTEDLIAIGYLLLKNGKYNNHQILSKQYVDLMFSKQVDSDGHSMDWKLGYGLHMWQGQNDFVRADGYMGQYILISKEHNMVIAITAATEKMNNTLLCLYKHIPHIYKIHKNTKVDIENIQFDKPLLSSKSENNVLQTVFCNVNKNDIQRICIDNNEMIITLSKGSIKASIDFYTKTELTINNIESICAACYKKIETGFKVLIRVIDSPVICTLVLDVIHNNITVIPNFSFSETSNLFFHETITLK